MLAQNVFKVYGFTFCAMTQKRTNAFPAQMEVGLCLCLCFKANLEIRTSPVPCIQNIQKLFTLMFNMIYSVLHEVVPTFRKSAKMSKK